MYQNQAANKTFELNDSGLYCQSQRLAGPFRIPCRTVKGNQGGSAGLLLEWSVAGEEWFWFLPYAALHRNPQCITASLAQTGLWCATGAQAARDVVEFLNQINPVEFICPIHAISKPSMISSWDLTDLRKLGVRP